MSRTSSRDASGPRAAFLPFLILDPDHRGHRPKPGCPSGHGLNSERPPLSRLVTRIDAQGPFPILDGSDARAFHVVYAKFFTCFLNAARPHL